MGLSNRLLILPLLSCNLFIATSSGGGCGKLGLDKPGTMCATLRLASGALRRATGLAGNRLLCRFEPFGATGPAQKGFEMQPQPQRISPRSEISSRTATLGFATIPNSFIENLALVTHAEACMVMIVCRRGENTVSDRHWEDWTGLKARIKDNAIRGLKEKGLTVRGRGDSAKYYFERDKWDSWVRSRPRRERARTAGRSASVTAKLGMQIHQECRERGCGRLCEPQVIPFPATPVEQPVAQERRAEDQIKAKSVPGVSTRPPESPPKKFPQSLGAVQTFFPHVEPEFIDKLRARCDRKVKQYTDTQLAQAINKAMKRTQTSDGLFLDTVPGHLAVILSTRSDLTETQKRELKMARMILEGRQVDSSNPIEWTPDAIEQAREILRKYGG